MKRVLGIILGGGAGTRLYPLTKLRAKPAVPVAGKYRLIDIPVSNCINSEILVAFSLAGAAHAQTAPPVATSDTSDNDIVVADYHAAPDIVVAARVPQFPDQVGQAVTVLTRADIERRQTIVLSDLLATTPGVTVSRTGGIGTVTAVRIRGAEGEQTLTIIDGIRVNDPSSPGGAFDFGTLLAGSIDRIEVLRGPNSVPWGSQAIGGVINIVTATPTTGVQARGQIEYGSHDHAVRKRRTVGRHRVR